MNAAPAAGGPVLEIREVTKSFGEREVLRGIGLSVAEHEAVAVIGASGSGKSTLLRCVDLLEEIDDGDVLLDGEVVTDPAVSAVSVRRRLGRELLGLFGLPGREDDRPDGHSGGQQQRDAIARAFAGRPRVMLLDEVTSALDPELVGEVLAAVRDLKEEGMTMLIATHEMSFAREVADRVAFLDEGRIAELGPAEQVLSEPRDPGTRRFLARLLAAGRG